MNKGKQVVILAGGLGSRLRPFTEAIPKPLLPLGEKSILEVQILQLKKHGFTDIFIATNYKADYIQAFLGNGERLGVNITFSKESKPLGTCGPLSLLEDRLGDSFLVMNGDILTTIDYSDLFVTSQDNTADLTVVTKELIVPYAFGTIHSKDGYITGVEEKPDIKHEILAGMYIMKKTVFRHIPKDEYFGMDTLIKTMLEGERKIAKYLMRGLWLDVGQLPDYEKAQNLYEEHFKE